MFRRFLLFAVCLAALCGCEASYPTIPTQSDVVARVILQYRFPTSAVTTGSIVSFDLLAVSPDGAYTNVTAQSQFFSSDLTVIRPTAGATLSGVGPGAAQIVGAYNGFSAALPVLVRTQARPFPYIDLSGFGPGAVGGFASVRAILVQGPSQSRLITTEGTWTSSDPSVATVSAGTVQTFTVGTAVLTVTFNGLSESIYMSVGPRS